MRRWGRTPANSFETYVFYEMHVSAYGFVFLSALVCGVLGVLFYQAVFGFRRLFEKLRSAYPRAGNWAAIGSAVLLGGAFSLITVNVMGEDTRSSNPWVPWAARLRRVRRAFFRFPSSARWR